MEKTDIIMAVDPGTVKSAYVLYASNSFTIVDKGYLDNKEMLSVFEFSGDTASFMVLETVKSFGNMGGDSLYTTCIWIGRFISAWLRAHSPDSYTLAARKAVVTHLCGVSKAGDTQIRQVLIDYFSDNGVVGGGKIPIIGIKKNPGTLYGITGDIWSALSLAVFWSTVSEEERNKNRSVL